MINISSKTGMETFSVRMYLRFSPPKTLNLEYLSFIVNGHSKIHERGNVVDSES